MLHLISKSKYKRLSTLAALCSVIGLALLFFAVQLFQTWGRLNGGGKAFLIVNKPVSLVNTFSGAGGFSEAEMDGLARQPGVERLGPFIANDFEVSLGSYRLGFRTDAFFETVPDAFVDVAAERWNSYRPGGEIPIVVSSDYLALYNFGFAPSKGLPQLTAGSIGMVSLDITLRGNGKTGRYKGRIVGFSQRLNSIIVPGDFMAYANQKYGGGSSKKTPARLILEVEEDQTAGLLAYLKNKGYQTKNSGVFGEETARMVRSGIYLIALLGLFVLGLTMLISYLSYQLIVAERAEDIRILFTQGYGPETVGRHFARIMVRGLGVALAVALLLNMAGHYFIARSLRNAGLDAPSFLSWPTFAFAFLVAALLLGGMWWMVQRTISARWR